MNKISLSLSLATVPWSLLAKVERGRYTTYGEKLLGLSPAHAAFLDQRPEGCVEQVVDMACAHISWALSEVRYADDSQSAILQLM